jgi:hypothetical protein
VSYMCLKTSFTHRIQAVARSPISVKHISAPRTNTGKPYLANDDDRGIRARVGEIRKAARAIFYRKLTTRLSPLQYGTVARWQIPLEVIPGPVSEHRWVRFRLKRPEVETVEDLIFKAGPSWAPNHFADDHFKHAVHNLLKSAYRPVRQSSSSAERSMKKNSDAGKPSANSSSNGKRRSTKPSRHGAKSCARAAKLHSSTSSQTHPLRLHPLSCGYWFVPSST